MNKVYKKNTLLDQQTISGYVTNFVKKEPSFLRYIIGESAPKPMSLGVKSLDGGKALTPVGPVGNP